MPQSVPAMTFSRPTRPRIADDSIGHQLRVLHDVGVVRDDAGDKNLALGQFHIAPDFPFVLVARVGGLERVSARRNLQHQVDHVLERQVVRVRAVPTAPADVIAHPVFGKPFQRLIQSVHPHLGEFAVIRDGRVRHDHVDRYRAAPDRRSAE